MSAPKGNQYWKARSSHGRKPIFDNPEQMMNACIEYFEHADANPIVSYKPYVTKDGAVEQLEHIYPRPYTMEGLSVFLDINQETFAEYEKKQDFSAICKGIRETIRDQKLSGAIVGIYNHAIVARDLQLRDSSSVALEAPQGLVFNLNYKGE